MKVFTCYDDFKARKNPLIDLWREAWSKRGWTPVVLTPEDAKPHPGYSAFVAAVSRLPPSTIASMNSRVMCGTWP